MKLTKKQRDYIRQNASVMSDAQIASKLELNPTFIAQARKNMNLPGFEVANGNGGERQKGSKERRRIGRKIFSSRWMLLSVLFLLTVLVYHNTLFNTFVYDDKDVIVKKSFVKHLKNIPALFTSDSLIRSGELSYRPVVTLSYILDYAAWTRMPVFRYFELNNFLSRSIFPAKEKIERIINKDKEKVNDANNAKIIEAITKSLGKAKAKEIVAIAKHRPLGFHITNLLLHIINVLIVFAFVAVLTGSNFHSLCVSLLYAVHTLNTETVNSISYREDIYTAIFCLLALIFYIKYIRSGKNARSPYYLSLIFYFFGVFSKEMALSFPILIVLYDYLFVCECKLKNIFKRIIPIYSGFAAVTFFYLLVRFYFFRDMHETEIPYPGNSMYTNILTMSTVFLHYLKLLFIPVGLTCHYLFDVKKSIFDPLVVLSIILHLAIFWAAWSFRRKHKYISFCIFGYYVLLLPVMNIFPVVNIVAERYLYYPLVFFCLFVVLVLDKFFSWFLPPLKLSKYKELFFLGVLCIILAILSTLSYSRNQDWFDNYTLWKSAVKIQPWSAKAHNNLGLAYKEKGLYEQSIVEYKEAMRVNPTYTDAGNNLAILYGEVGDHDLELEMYRHSLSINPNDATMNYNTGMAHMEQGKVKEGLVYVKRAVEIEARYVNAHNGLAIIYSRLGKYKLAKIHWEIALSIDPDHPSARKNYRHLIKFLDKK